MSSSENIFLTIAPSVEVAARAKESQLMDKFGVLTIT